MKQQLRQLAKVDALLATPQAKEWIDVHGRAPVVEALRSALDSVRNDLLAGTDLADVQSETWRRAALHLERSQDMRFRRIINATGIVLHTNMGRALLSDRAARAVDEAVRHYNNLELDLASGRRGSRYQHVVDLITRITGAEDALVVNNNAAAVLLVLDTIAKGGETLLSRGEMVEIGGSFRVPEVMKLSGTTLVEIGTTNKTHLFDYEQAITERTRAILKVHTSNYRILGFSEAVAREDLMALAKRHDLVVYEDLGSGFLADLEREGISTEPRVQDVVESGIDVVTFSGDKLLGGPQAGIIVGRRELIGRMKRNQLNRALRIDKMTIAALEATLRDYLDPERVKTANPTLRMLTSRPDQLQQRAEALRNRLAAALDRPVSVEADQSPAGGGSLPGVMLPTVVVRLSMDGLDEDAFTARLRLNRPSVMARKNRGDLVLDVRTLDDSELDELVAALRRALTEETT